MVWVLVKIRWFVIKFFKYYVKRRLIVQVLQFSLVIIGDHSKPVANFKFDKKLNYFTKYVTKKL